MAQAIMNMDMPGLEDLGDEEAVEQGMAQVMMNMEMEYLPRATSDRPNQEMATSSGRFPPPGPLMPQAIEMNIARTPTLNLQEKFETLVMVNYTPRSPTELPMAQWASCDSPPFEPGTHLSTDQWGPRFEWQPSHSSPTEPSATPSDSWACSSPSRAFQISLVS